ncbi:DUF2384 domain-containing protein [Alteromonas sp. IB21]|uniref:antitoxin Xre/MbcA/ParS toxin-binding domain-containing protein n=1 Tax=Alteromonas sp. IB21 TaxID=2779369 RepID=UPI0018E75AD5|nr:antitoxin Xre/MbcA/ParS toxin-binding domain-containing protein [Alteromonas sp. IB21]MBJ2129826.1 DUF2384 domain-containing protein [Alteromonas sp. IB21]
MTFATEYYALTGKKLSHSILEEISVGLPISSARVIQNSLSLTMYETSKLLHCPMSSLKRKDVRLSTISSDKALFLMRVVQYGEDTFENKLHLRKWIRLSNIGLGNKTPLEIMHFSIGIETILDSLERQKCSFVA